MKHGVNAASERAAAAPGARTDADALIGRWRAEKARQYLSDGTVREGGGGCTSEFSAQRMITECPRPEGKLLRVVYSYRVLVPGRFEMQMVENSGFPQLVGTRTMGAFRVEDGKLITGAYPSTANAEATRPIEVESIFVRDPGTPRSQP